MAGQIAAAEGAILRGADIVSEAREELSGKIRTVESQMQSIGGSWQGIAAVAFQNLIQAWNQDANKVNSALVGLEESLRKTQTDIDSTEENHMTSFGRLASRLG